MENTFKKELCLIELYKKYQPTAGNSSEKLKIAKQYIDKFLAKTAIITIDIKHITDRANK